MRYMLDTNICIYLINHKTELVINNLKKHNPNEICISSVTLAELMYGVIKSQAVEKNRIALTLFLSNIDILDFDAYASESYGLIRTNLERQGTPIGPMDMMIAAHAKSLGYTLVTNNTKEFNRVNDLHIENWAI